MEKETIYKGVKFRTKLEARWAVFFDDCNAKWTYRPKTFDLGNGDYFTPEFLLENVHGRGGDSLYVVVRTSISKEEERIIDKFNKKDEVHKEYGYRLIKNKVLFVSNLPPIDLSDSRYYTQFGNSYEGTDITPFNFESIDGDYFTAHPGINKNGQFELFGDDSTYLDDMDKIKTENAYDDAKQSFWNFEEENIKEAYESLNKKILVCTDCFSHIVLNNNESVDRCSKCGHKNLEEVPMPFIPLSYGQIKSKDMLEISIENITKYCEEAASYDNQSCFKIFLNDSVAKITNKDGHNFYIYTEDLGDNWCNISVYLRDNNTNKFLFIFTEDFMFDDEYITNNRFCNPVIQREMDESLFNEMYSKGISWFCITHTIFNYLAAKRKTEVIKVDVDRKSTQSEITKSGKVKVKKKHIVYMTDSIKVYTYDSKIAGKIRHHEPISIPFWKVKQHTRRVFAKEDRHLPKEQRRVVKTNIIKPFLKGKDRFIHSLDECEGTLYKIAR